jgi:hypothetical protein
MAFRDVARDRDRGAPQLIGKAESLGIGKRLGEPINRECHLNRLLPHFKLSKRFPHDPALS